MNKLLSIIIPAYNVERYIDQCLESFVLPKMMDDIEVLVIDDGGTDTTMEKARRFEERYPTTFRLFHKENGGHGSVINFGIEQAQGTYFKVVDGDDWVNTQEMPGFLRALATLDADVVASDYDCIEDGTLKLLGHRASATDASHYGHTWGFDVASTEPVVKIHSLTIKTSILKNNHVRVDEHCFYEDAEYILYPIPFCKTFYYDNHSIYQYRLGRAGQSVDIPSLQKHRGEHERVLASLFAFREQHKHAPAEVLAYLDRGIAIPVQNQYQIFLSAGLQDFKAMKAFDQKLKAEQPSIYQAVTKRSIWAIRKSGYALYPVGVLAFRLVKG